jgi:hypothetical protein
MPDTRTRYDDDSGFQIGTASAERKLLVKTNAFMKWGGYSEMKGFAPTDLEKVVITLNQKHVTATL